MFGGQETRRGLSEDVALRFEQFDGLEVVFREGAGPGLVGLVDGLVEGFAFQDGGGELDGPVGRGCQAAL